MNNPIKYIGKVKRDDISFEINIKSQKKLGKTEYENSKADDLTSFLENTFDRNEKSIVYFPYASQARHAKDQTNEFAKLLANTHKIGLYVGRNINKDSKELFNQNKHEVFEKFRKNEINAVFATKAFGMGVDVNDINNVYHYAVSGNLSDYIQEVGRAARKKDMHGTAYLDFYPNDMNFMQILFGMSQIRQWQVKQVLSNIYNIYLSKQSRNFLISPQAFTYIFSGKSKDDDKEVINKLKTCLMMIEKDINDKNKFNVIITRPQSIFTKAFAVINDDHKEEILNSKYGDYFKYEHEGRFRVAQIDHYKESIVSDMGDIYTVNLKGLWEDFYQNISFAQFKYWYFNPFLTSKNKIDIIPEIREYIYPRQRIVIQSHHDLLISQIQKNIIQELDKIRNDLYSTFGSNYFTLDKFTDLLVLYDNMTRTKAKLIADSLFDIVDPTNKCIRYRDNKTIGTREYCIRYGIFGDLMKGVINKANIVKKMEKCNEQTFSSYICLDSSDKKYDSRALKLLSIFDYITYEVAGGEEPEIFVRLNDPSKIERIVNGRTKYSNDYVTRAQQKHKRDVDILRTFFLELNNDKDRWNFIEDYFLGKDVLDNDYFKSDDDTPLANKIDKNKSFSTSKYKKWKDLSKFIDDSYGSVITEMNQNKITLPEYLSTVIKKFEWTNDIVMSWPSKNTIIFSQDINDELLKRYTKDGYTVYRIFEIDYSSLKKEVG